MKPPKTFSSYSTDKLKYIAAVLSIIGLSGCSTLIYDKHVQTMKGSPERLHYATAIPFGSHEATQHAMGRETAYNLACGYPGSLKSYHRDASSPHFIGMGGRNQDEVEKYTIRECETRYGRTCIVVIYNNVERCAATFADAYAREEAKLKERRDRADRLAEERSRKKVEQITQTCLSFGFKSGTNELSKCVLEMHNSLAQIEAIRNAGNRHATAIEAANAEASKLREFEQGMLLLQGSANILNSTQPNRSGMKCRYNTLMKTITCD